MKRLARGPYYNRTHVISQTDLKRNKNFLAGSNNMNEFSYRGKCDNCKRMHPGITIAIINDRGDGAYDKQFWCTDCIRGVLHKNG